MACIGLSRMKPSCRRMLISISYKRYSLFSFQIPICNNSAGFKLHGSRGIHTCNNIVVGGFRGGVIESNLNWGGQRQPKVLFNGCRVDDKRFRRLVPKVASDYRNVSTSVESHVKDTIWERIYIQGGLNVVIEDDYSHSNNVNIPDTSVLGRKKNESEIDKEAWKLLRGSIVNYCGSPVGTVAATDPADKLPLNYDQVFIHDFVPSALAFMLNGEGDIVKNFLLHTLQLQSWEKTVDCHNPGQGLMPSSFKVRNVALDGRPGEFEDVLDPDFGESAIGRVAPVDSGLWWIILLRDYGKITGDYSLQERVDDQTEIRLILKLCLAGKVEEAMYMLDVLRKSDCKPDFMEYRIETEAEELTLDASEVVIISTRQEIEEQWRLYNGFDPVLERKLQARIRRNVSCYGRFMPRMVVIPPGMEFNHIIPHDSDMDGENEGNEDRQASPDPPIWTEIMCFFSNPRKPMILALARPDPKKNLTTLVKAFGECRPLREVANLTC